jgi:hypothetical protein
MREEGEEELVPIPTTSAVEIAAALDEPPSLPEGGDGREGGRAGGRAGGGEDGHSPKASGTNGLEEGGSMEETAAGGEGGEVPAARLE